MTLLYSIHLLDLTTRLQHNAPYRTDPMALKTHSSTDDFDPLTYRPHGRVTFTVEGDVLICDAVGPFNKELIAAIETVEMGPLLELKSRGKWGEIIIISGSALGSTDTLVAFTAYLKKLVAEQFMADVTALVMDNQVEGGTLMTPHLIKAYKDAGIELTIFDTVNEARVWVKLHL